MAVASSVKNLAQVLRERSTPAITRFNRLEGRPRAHQFERALRAEIRDPLWMLTRQWQLGEFRGDDAGSPVLAHICAEVMRFDRYQARSGTVEPLANDVPLETQVERRALRWRARDLKLALDLRLALGRYFQRLLAREFDAGRLQTDYRDAYRTQYAVVAPNPANPADAPVCAHPEVWQQVSAAAGRAMDGYALLEYLDTPGHNAWDGIGADAADHARLAALADELREWLARLIAQPGAADAWQAEKLEYQFGCSAPLGAAADFVARAEQYYHGHLDWYAFERGARTSLGDTPSGGPAPQLDSAGFFPMSLVFSGMPCTRWWQFEERRTNFGQVKPDRTDLGKLLLLEFGLVYANDWFVLPYTLPIGSIIRVHGIAITNVFGERIWVEPVREHGEAAWERWSMYRLTGAGDLPALLLAATTPQTQQGPALEEVALVRDEMANLVYGIERRVPLASGTSKPGGEAARELVAHLRNALGAQPAPPPAAAPLRYRLMNAVPEHWIPFVPVRQPGSVLETRLQRAAMPRLLGTDPSRFALVEPRTGLLRVGLDDTPAQPYFINEEEVPRAGAQVTLAWQRARWLDGRTFVWLGVTKTTGRGEAASGLAFDQLVPADKGP